MFDDTTCYELLSLLEQNPTHSQGELAKAGGISLGKLNLCIDTLVEKGRVKTRSFQNTQRKRADLFKLPPLGIDEKRQVTRCFLECKLQEHEAITREISEHRKQAEKD